MKTTDELYREEFETMTVNDVPVLFTPLRIDRNIIPKGLFAYDIRESDDGDIFATIESVVRVNHAGTILSRTEFELGDKDYLEIEDYNFEGDSTTLAEWIEENT